ncbi:hypothetical protein [Mesorhizobium sp.]|uniref:hypothetical protein n=1 Tax=Mesorhizobium sp. TaxID=1871066 RepID=UPI00257CE02B|nr:hypothetical protein [Mesorhizobium sp.]
MGEREIARGISDHIPSRIDAPGAAVADQSQNARQIDSKPMAGYGGSCANSISSWLPLMREVWQAWVFEATPGSGTCNPRRPTYIQLKCRYRAAVSTGGSAENVVCNGNSLFASLSGR